MIQTIEKKILEDSKEIVCLHISNRQGASVALCNYGARWTSCIVPDKEGKMEEVLIGLPSIRECLGDTYYKGATVGRVANRIANASFQLKGKTYHLDLNDGKNSNHGGFHGFSHQVWDYKVQDESNQVIFSLHSPDGEGGFPGNVDVKVTYTWTDDNQLIIEHQGVTDEDTYLNMTCHAYLNLSGRETEIYEHLLEIPASQILETTDEYIPTGKLLDVEGTPFDFQKLRKIGVIEDIDNESMRQNRGYNHCYSLLHSPICHQNSSSQRSQENNFQQELHQAALLLEPKTGRKLQVCTSLPGVLIYSAGFLPHPSTGICFETQYWPDTPNHPEFPSCLLRKGENYHETTVFHFSTSNSQIEGAADAPLMFKRTFEA